MVLEVLLLLSFLCLQGFLQDQAVLLVLVVLKVLLDHLVRLVRVDREGQPGLWLQ